MDSGQSQPQPSHQQPQDVLAEARKNLQVLIDSGLSRDLLHQLVDGSHSLQLAAPTQQQSLLIAHQSNPQQLPPQQNHQQPQQQPHLASQLPSQQPSSLAPPPPPPPQCPPPPPPTAAQHAQQQQQKQQQQQQQSLHSPPVPQHHLTDNSQQAQSIQQHAVSPTPTPTTVPTPSPGDVKPDLQISNDMTTAWQAAGPLGGTSPANAPPAMLPFTAPASFIHRPRISVSSTSSGSSGHASIFSNLSSHSAMSWASASSAPRMQAPNPLPPQISPPGLMNGGQVGASGSSSKQNIYWCTSCETSFKRKYDWKRHEDEFHERWRKYPCPEPGCNRSFWGSNSFNQHHKQCHGCTTCPHAEKVVRFLRKRKYWACGFCSALHPARERHVEHVARHFESGMTKGEWMHSRVVYGLLHQPLIHEAWDALITSKNSEYGGRRPRFSWHPTKTGRAQGFLEKENPGQLQDLLEFFSGDEGEAQWIASVAYDLADIVMDNAQLTPPQFPTTHNPVVGAPASYQDRMAFAPMQQHQSMMPPSGPGSQASSYAAPPFQNPMLMSSQQTYAHPAGPSPPSSTSHSPLASNHSPVTSNQPSLIKQEPRHPVAHTGDGSEGMMDFEYSPAPVIFEEWDSIHGSIDDTTSQSNTGSQSDWGSMMEYFNDPRPSA